jgi:hypothetical protein
MLVVIKHSLQTLGISNKVFFNNCTITFYRLHSSHVILLSSTLFNDRATYSTTRNPIFESPIKVSANSQYFIIPQTKEMILRSTSVHYP